MGRGRLSDVLLDTHAWAWTLTADARLSKRASEAITAADAVFVSAISLYEIGQKVRLGKWPDMSPHLMNLLDIAEDQGVQLLPVSPISCLAGADFRWAHRDPFDRIIGATAFSERLTLISADSVFDELSNPDFWPGRLW